MNIQDAFLNLKDKGEEIHIIEKDGCRSTMTYGTLVERAHQVLGGLQDFGVPEGAPLVLQCHSIEKTLTVFWAAILGGYLPAILSIPVDRVSQDMFQKNLELLVEPWVLTDIENMVVPVDTKVLPLRALSCAKPGQVVHKNSEDPGMLQFTSGSTSAPKGALLTLKNLLVGAIASSVVVRPGVIERYISWLPLSHCFGFVANHLVPLVNGFPQMLIHPSRFLRDPAIWIREAGNFGATISGLPVFGIEALLKVPLPQNVDLSAMHVCFVGGEDIDPQAIWDLEARLGPLGFRKNTFSPAYGLSETTMGVAYTPVDAPLRVDAFLNETLYVGDRLFFCEPDPDIMFRVSVGVLDACNEVEIRDDTGAPLPAGHLGHIVIKGSNVMKGYYPCTPGADSGIEADGAFYTGDLGWFHQGWLTIFGRTKDVLIHNGKNYLVTDLEKTASGDGTPVVLIKGTVHDVAGTQLVLFGTGSREQIVDAARRLATYWHLRPGYGVCLDAIPKTSSGKIDRTLLTLDLARGAYSEELFSLGTREGGTPTEAYATMAQLWSEVLNSPEEAIVMESHFILDLGGDSLGIADLLWRLEKLTGKSPNFEVVKDHLTLKEMTEIYFLNLGDETKDQ